MFYFFILCIAFAFTGYRAFESGQGSYIGQFALFAPHAVALLALSSKARWSYFYCAALLFLFPAFLLGSMLLIIFKVPNAPIATLVPSLLGAALFFWLFYSFTFGDASKAFYGAKVSGSGA
ncbi:MAG: hypothetical protein Q8Q73_01970 [Stagnimonas sp.]|nr:hypothetical protein [Stagnimonas sp.]